METTTNGEVKESNGGKVQTSNNVKNVNNALKRSSSYSTFIRPAALGAPLTRSYSVSPEDRVDLAQIFGLYQPGWTFYHYNGPNYRSLWPYRTWSERYFSDFSLYDKYNAFSRLYKPIPLHRPFSHYSKHPCTYWTVSYDYVYDFDDPSRLYSREDPFYDEYRRWDRYRSKFVDRLHNPRCFYHYARRKHYFY